MKALRQVDNAGKLFLSTYNRQVTNVFRFSCELCSSVNADILNEAISKTVKCFPFFQVVVKKSKLWYCFEQSELEPSLVREPVSQCAPIYQKNSKTLLYRIFFHDHQIHLEVFHALSDGAGVSYFFRLLIGAYLIESHKDVFGQAKLTDYFDVQSEMYELDGFQTHYRKPTARMQGTPSRSFQIKGERLPDHQIRVYRAILSTRDVLHECRSRHVSLTEMLTAVYIDTIHKTMSAEDERYPVTISIPVNLRKYFPSEYAGNFSTLISVKYDFSKNPSNLPAILEHIHRELNEKLRIDRLRDTFSRFVRYERNTVFRAAPLVIKNSILRFSGWLVKPFSTSFLANLGRIQMPPAFTPYIIRFNCFDRTDSVKMCVISYENELCVNIVSAMTDDFIPLTFLDALSAMGFPIHVMPER